MLFSSEPEVAWTLACPRLLKTERGTTGKSEPGRPSWERPRFVADLSRCVSDWERTVAAPSIQHGPALAELMHARVSSLIARGSWASEEQATTWPSSPSAFKAPPIRIRLELSSAS